MLNRSKVRSARTLSYDVSDTEALTTGKGSDFIVLQALLDVDEVYTIEQRINQDASGVSPSSKNTAKRKKKKKSVLENELPCALAGTVEISLPTSASDTGELDLCTKEGNRERSSERNSPKEFLPLQPITSNQSSKESVSTCKEKHCQISASDNEVAANSNCASIIDLPLSGNESVLPSAQSLSIALRASVSGLDDDFLKLTEVTLTEAVLDNAAELETVMGQNDSSLATREENYALNISWNDKLIEKMKKDKEESNKLANTETFDNKESGETGDVRDLSSCSFSNNDSGVVSNAILNNNTKQGQGLRLRTKGSCLPPNGMELLRDNGIADYHTTMPIENSQQLTAIGKEDKLIKIPDTGRLRNSEHDVHEKNLLQMEAETHKIDIKDLCDLRENCLKKKALVVCCSEKDDSSNSDIVTFLRSSSIVSTEAVASFSTKGETVMQRAEAQLNERAANESCKDANLAHCLVDYDFIRSETPLCKDPVSSESRFALCSETANAIPNEVRQEPGSPSRPRSDTPSIDAPFSEVFSNTEEDSTSRYHEGKGDKCFFQKKDQHDLALKSSATVLQEGELQEDYHSITQVTQMFSEPKEDGASAKLEDLEKVPHDALKHENSGQDILENSKTAASFSSETNSPFRNLLSMTGKIADAQASSHSFREGVNVNPGQKEAHNETSSMKGDEKNCQSLKTEVGIGEKRTYKKTYKNDDNSDKATEYNPHKEEGEISSVKDDGLPPNEKSKNGEKEEGELSSSDSDDDSSLVKHCDTNDGKGVQSDNRLKDENKQARPRARTDSSRDFPDKFLDDRSNSRREYSSHSVQNAGLRRKLRGSRKKVLPSTKVNSSKETSNRVRNRSRSDMAAKKNNCVEKHNRDELLTEEQKHGRAQSTGIKDERRSFIHSAQGKECKTKEKGKFLDKQNEKPSNSSQDAETIKKRSESKSEIKNRINIPCPPETDEIVPNKFEVHQLSTKDKETKKLRTPENATVDKDFKEETQLSKTVTRTRAKTTLHPQIVKTGTKSVRPLSRQSEETLMRRPLSVDNFGSRKHVSENRQGSTISHRTHCLEQSKTKRKDEAKTTTTDIGKWDISGKRKTTPSKTAPRVTTRNTPKKSPIANKRRTKPQNSSDDPLENPRKRMRPTESTEKRKSKKARGDEQRNSSTADTIEPNMSTAIAQCNDVKNSESFCIKVKDSANQMNPDKLEYFQLNKTEHKCQNSPAIKSVASRAKPILFGRNKFLVFKRRHVNQLFIRGDNVAMIAYAE